MSTDKSKENKRPEVSISPELSKKLSSLGKSQKRRGIFGKVNPFILLVTAVMSIFLIIGFSAQSVTIEKIDLSTLVEGLENNNYSELLIQNDGGVVAREKEFLISEEDYKFSGDKEEVKVTEGSDLEKVSFNQIKNLFQPLSLVDQIRAITGSGAQEITDVLFLEEDTIVVTNKGFEDYILEDVSRAKFEQLLEDNDLSLASLGIQGKDLRIFGKEISNDSIDSRIDRGIVTNIIDLGDFSIAKIDSKEVKQFGLDWSPAIFTFPEFLQQEGFSVNSGTETFILDTRSVSGGVTIDTILTLITIGAFIFLGVVIFRSAQASGMGIMQFGQSKAKMFFGQKTGVTFKDVAGIDEAREELNEIVDFLKNPNKYRKLGARIPKGILMFGPPGTGKTLLARAIAGEAGVPFFHTSGSEFEEMLVGAGASRVRDLFAKAKKAAPALIFIDEIDAVARKRGTRIQSGSTEQTLNQILVEMDGFETSTNVIVIAATNRPDVLDRAILRPGRFDRQVRIEAPDKDGRIEILKIHSKNKPLEQDVNLETIAKRTVGFTGADLENIMNESAIIAAKDNRKTITNKDIDDAVSKVVLGPAKKSRKRTEDEINLVAYHEAGHALVAKMTEGSVPVDKISIVSRGSTGGVTMFLPEKDENIISMKKLIANIRVSLGGRAAEEVVLGDISTGASNDIEQATRTAKGMIQRYGMSKNLGLVQYGTSRDSEYLGYHYGNDADYSEETAKMIDHEIREMIQNEYKEALEIIKKNRAKLDELADLLKEKEVLEKDEFEKLFE